MRIVQLSDLHLRPGSLYSGIDPWAAWRQALDRAAALAPDLLLITGDLADDGAAATYQQLAESLRASGFAHAVLPGNHDERAALRAAFAGQHWSHRELACQRVDVGEFTLLLLDTMIAGVPGGEFTPAQEAWLNQHCPRERRVLLAMHHPPTAVGIPILDTIACANSDRLAAWLAGRPHVEAIFCGHVHRLVLTTLAGRPLMIAPSTVHQIALQDGPLAYTLEPPGFLIHDGLPGQPLRSHYLPLATAPVINYPE